MYEDECYAALRIDRLIEDVNYSDSFYTIHLSTQDKCNDTSMCNRRFAYDTDYQ